MDEILEKYYKPIGDMECFTLYESVEESTLPSSLPFDEIQKMCDWMKLNKKKSYLLIQTSHNCDE